MMFLAIYDSIGFLQTKGGALNWQITVFLTLYNVVLWSECDTFHAHAHFFSFFPFK